MKFDLEMRKPRPTDGVARRLRSEQTAWQRRNIRAFRDALRSIRSERDGGGVE